MRDATGNPKRKKQHARKHEEQTVNALLSVVRKAQRRAAHEDLDGLVLVDDSSVKFARYVKCSTRTWATRREARTVGRSHA